MFGSDKDSQHRKTPGWFKLLLLAFVVYAFVTHGIKQKPAEPGKPQASSAVQAIVDSLPGANKTAQANTPKDLAVGEKDPSRSINGFMTQMLPELRMTDVKEGDGDMAMCGQRVGIRYDGYLDDGTKFESNRDAAEPARFVLGEHKVIPAWEAAVLGMHVGGKRNVVVPAHLSYSAEHPNPKVKDNSNVSFDITLEETSPKLPSVPLSTRSYSVLPGNGAAAGCGDNVEVEVVIWGAQGDIAYRTPKAEPITIGRSDAAVGIEQALVGIAVGELRTVIMPPAYFKSLHGGNREGMLPVIHSPLAELKFPANQTVIMDIFRPAPVKADTPAKDAKSPGKL